MNNEEAQAPSGEQERIRSASGAVEESLARRPRRTFSPAEKVRIVRLAAACRASGERGALEMMMRKEGIYSSQLSAWQAQLGTHGTAGMAARKPGRKAKFDAKDRLNAELEKRNVELERELYILRALVELQKKAHEILGIALPSTEGTR